MSTAATLMEFFGQKVASLMRQLSGVQIVATPSRQFRKTNKLRPGFHSFFPNSVNTVGTIGSSIFNVKYPSYMPTPLAVTRSARRVSNSANVPRLGLRPRLLLDFAALDTQHAPLVAAGYQRSQIERGVGFLGSDSNIHAKHPLGTPEGWWILDSDPNKPGRTNTFRTHIAFNSQLLGGGEDE